MGVSVYSLCYIVCVSVWCQIRELAETTLDISKLDALLQKHPSRFLWYERIGMCRFIDKICCDHTFSQRNKATKRAVGRGVNGARHYKGSSLNRGVRNFLPVLVFYCSNQSSRQGLCLCKQFFEISENEKHFWVLGILEPTVPFLAEVLSLYSWHEQEQSQDLKEFAFGSFKSTFSAFNFR